MTLGYTSWLPETELTSTFSNGLKENKLMGTKCRECGARYLPPRAQCRCGSAQMEWFEAPSKGKILTCTLIVQPSESMIKYAPYIIALAELEDGSRIMAQLSEATLKTTKVGMQVEVVSHTVERNVIIYKFVPL